jgi:hypothetical protein
MAENLTEYLQGTACQGFKAVPHYFASGDHVSYYFRNDPCFARRIDDLLTVYLSQDTRELVGCKIKGVRHILDTAGEFGVLLNDGQIRMGLFFFYGAARAEHEEQKRQYEELGKIAKEAVLPKGELQDCPA